MLAFYKITFLCIITFLLLQSCINSNNSLQQIQEYNGPAIEVKDATTLYSDSAIVRIKLQAAVQLEFMTGDREFPSGIYIEFYEQDGKLASTLRANKGYYYAHDNRYKVLEDVEIENLEKKEKLNTEILFWKPDDEEVYTKEFVRIETQDEILMGIGLTAKQDFSDYRIDKPVGSFNIEEEEFRE